MGEKPVFLTAEGRIKLAEELSYLVEVKRPGVADRIRAAKEFGDTTDDADFEEAKNEQAFIEGRILTLEKMLSHAVIIEHDSRHDVVRLGATVTVAFQSGDPDVNGDGDTARYTIVGSAEANPLAGRISNESPVGQALLGRRVGEAVDVRVPAGTVRFQVVSIE
ncbi:MAG: transcription elongation factor GreA [Chloroflexi bacterium]|nr:transcription elongation factor GreA [Chloroflexota bacterium]